MIYFLWFVVWSNNLSCGRCEARDASSSCWCHIKEGDEIASWRNPFSGYSIPPTHFFFKCHVLSFSLLIIIVKIFYRWFLMQIGGSKSARLGVLFSASQEADLHSLIFVKAFDITASTYRFVKFLKAPYALYFLKYCKHSSTCFFKVSDNTSSTMLIKWLLVLHSHAVIRKRCSNFWINYAHFMSMLMSWHLQQLLTALKSLLIKYVSMLRQMAYHPRFTEPLFLNIPMGKWENNWIRYIIISCLESFKIFAWEREKKTLDESH